MDVKIKFWRVLGDQVGAEQSLDGCDAILQLQFTLFQAPQLQLVERGAFLKAQNRHIEVVMFDLQFH